MSVEDSCNHLKPKVECVSEARVLPNPGRCKNHAITRFDISGVVSKLCDSGIGKPASEINPPENSGGGTFSGA